LGSDVRCTGISPLRGGELDTVLRLDFDREPGSAVIKLNDEADHDGFAAEHARLDYLRERCPVPVPRVYARGGAGEALSCSYMLLELLPGTHLGDAGLSAEERRSFDRQLAQACLELHAHTNETFGVIEEEYRTQRWSEIAVPRLIDMRDEMKGRLPDDVLADIDRAVAAAREAFKDQGTPALVHGDLWGGNILVERVNGDVRISGLLDPGAQYADVEMELAYLETFETAGPTFFEVYNATTPMRPGYDLRKMLYRLNTMMVHVWLLAAPPRSKTTHCTPGS
jgi:fructosamine-3-kinase